MLSGYYTGGEGGGWWGGEGKRFGGSMWVGGWGLVWDVNSSGGFI